MGWFPGCNDEEYKSHFSLWCMLAAPLIVNLDVRNMNEATKNILLNKEMIAINQDPLGKQGYKFMDEGDFEVWVKELSNEEIAICFLNRSSDEIKKKFDLQSVVQHFNFQSNSYSTMNVWDKNSKQKKQPNKVLINSHGVVMWRLKKSH